jgi:hypothetical protein
MTENRRREQRLVLFQRSVALGVWFLWVLLPSGARAQDADVGLSVQPAPEVRLTGTLEAVKEPQASAYPVLSVWIDGTPWVFRVSQVEPVLAAYPAEQELQKVSGLGLRLLADRAVLAKLQAPEMHDRPIVLEGWLRVTEGVLQVQSVSATASQ